MNLRWHGSGGRRRFGRGDGVNQNELYDIGRAYVAQIGTEDIDAWDALNDLDQAQR